MKFHTLPAIIVSMILSACATEPPAGQDTLATHGGPHAGEKSQCADANAPPSIGCSDTVTAAFDKQGKLWIVWTHQDRIYLQSSEDKGGHFSEPAAVNAVPESIAAHGEYRPKIKADGEGNLYLTWTQNLEKRHTGHIRFSRSTDGGKTFSMPVTVNDNRDVISHRFDSLAAGKNGEVFIAWLDGRDKEQAKADNREFNGTSLYYVWSDDGGKSFHPNKIAAPHSCECCRLGTEIDNDNLPVILWRQVFDGGIRDHALLKFTDWNTPGAIRRVGNENWKIDACPHHGPTLSIAGNGVYHAAWFSGGGERQGLFYGQSHDGGRRFSQPYHFGRQGARHPSVLAVGRQVAIVWSEFDGKENLLQLIRSTDEGKTWSQPEQIGATANKADDAFLLSDGQNMYLSWQTGDGYRFMPVNGLQ